MTQTASSESITVTKKKKYSPALHNGMFYVKTNKVIMIINFVLHLLALPFMLIMLMNSFSKGIRYEDIDGLVIVTGVICTFAGVVSGIFTVCSVFKSMYNRQHMDMEFSMPMSSKSRFLSDYLSGLFVYTAPYLAAEMVSLILWGTGAAMFEGKTLINTEEILYGGKPISWVCTFFSDNFSLCIEFIIGGFLIMLMFYTVWTLVMTCCGSMFEVIIYGFAANIVPPALIGTVYLTLMESLYGVDVSREILRILGVTSPSGAVFGLIASSASERNIFDSSPGYYLGYWEWMLLMIVVTAVIFAGAFFLYYRRTAEKTGQPFAYRLFYNIILIAVTFAICCISMDGIIGEYSDRVPAAAAMFIITFIVFMLLEFFSHRGFKKIRRSLLKYAAVMIGSTSLYFIAFSTGFFGTVTYVPPAMLVESADIEYSGFYQESSLHEYKITDRDNIKLIIEAHRNETELYKINRWGNTGNYISSDPSAGYFAVEYHLAGGKTVERSYSLHNSSRMFLKDLDASDEFKTLFMNNISALLDRYYISPEDEKKYIDRYGSLDYEKLSSLIFRDKMKISSQSYSKSSFPEDFAERMKENLTLDINAMSAEEFFHPTAPDVGVIEIPIFTDKNRTDSESIVIRSCYSNTIAYLKSIGKGFPILTSYEIDLMLRNSEICIGHIDSSEIDLPVCIGSSLMNSGYIGPAYTVSSYADMIKEIIDNSFTEYIVDENCYTISTGNHGDGTQFAYIPKKYYEAAEWIYNNVKDQNDQYEIYY